MSILPKLEAALQILVNHANAAINHGDPHVSNVLLPTDAHAELIDFERTTVGHPLYDIAHLTTSLVASSYRTYGTFESTVDLFDQHLFGDAEAPGFDGGGSKVNALVLHGCATAKDRAKHLVEHYHLSDQAFPAMMVTVAAMTILYLPHLSAECAKALFVASARHLVKPVEEA